MRAALSQRERAKARRQRPPPPQPARTIALAGDSDSRVVCQTLCNLRLCPEDRYALWTRRRMAALEVVSEQWPQIVAVAETLADHEGEHKLTSGQVRAIVKKGAQ